MVLTNNAVVGLIFGTSAVSAAIGGAATYFISRNQFEAKYREIAEQEIAEARRFYAKRHKASEFSDPTVVLKSYEAKINVLEYGDGLAAPDTHKEKHETVEIEEKLVLETYEEPFPEEPDPNKPYVIGHDIFYIGEKDYPQVTLTYFDGDGVLADERDKPIDDMDDVIGNDNLRFGFQSHDNNVVYVRNDRLGIDYEVVRSKGNYTKDVLGFIEHSARRGAPRKFRRDYE
jgi:hypothetical protein